MRHYLVLAIALASSVLIGAGSASAEGIAKESQISGAVSAAPEDRREEATVLGYSDAGELITLREGSNELICLADKPGDERSAYIAVQDLAVARWPGLAVHSVRPIQQVGAASLAGQLAGGRDRGADQ